MKSETPRGLKTPTSANSLTNAMHFMVTNMVRGWVHTAEVVRVVSVESGGPGAATGYVDVLPLVCQTDADNDILPPATLFHLPYARMQGGVAALVIDPEPGDIGLAVYAKRDSSNVAQEQKDPVQPGSFRSFNQADGFYIGGFLNKKPDIWLELNQDKVATLHAPEKVVIETKTCVVEASDSVTMNTRTCTINASASFNVNSPAWNFTGRNNGSGKGVMRGDVEHIGTYQGTGNHTLNGNFTQTGSHSTTGDQVAGGISQTGHRHTGVQGGSGTTGGPV